MFVGQQFTTLYPRWECPFNGSLYFDSSYFEYWLKVAYILTYRWLDDKIINRA